ncbi:RagB/SusD family nutrient uptake outer membrane protein [Flavicella sediminum]|uniref:RagB/SusD family nutrient uptake outer membrane protein n=1 Tax=Flavicella sediminum TaxID=2585141 RepID=UPI0011221995|nr:RagB/SusD family nutrient uptake outer membrane protein [Flavicella sediminum]
MKHIILKYTLYLFTLSLLNACSEEDLYEVDPNRTSTANYWQDLSETQTGLNAAYHILNSEYTLNIIEESLRSDMGWPGYGRPTPNAINEFYNQTFNNGNPTIGYKWENNYQGIFRANQVIEGLTPLEGTVNEEEWTSQMAQARFLRGLYHFYLYTTFNNGSIIIRNETPKGAADYDKALSSAEEVIAFIREDLEYAYANLYAKGEYPTNLGVGYATSGAAATILGTSYLYELNYNKAMTYFEDVINNHNYELVTDMDLLFTTAGEHNAESIFEINCNNTLFPEANLWNGEAFSSRLAQLTTNSTGSVAPAWLVYEYKIENQKMDPLDERNYYQDETNGRTARNVSLRTSAMMAIVEDEQTPYYLTASVTENMKIKWDGWGFGWHKKFSNHDIVESESDLPGGSIRSGKNITLNRLADVYLMQAECLIKTGDLPGALELINKIRQRWGLVSLGLSGFDTAHTYDEEIYDETSLMKHLMDVERPLELSLEGHAIRFLDLKRWEKSEGITVKQRFEKLSNEVYYALHYPFVDSKGANKWRWDASIVRTATPPTQNNFKTIDFEYDVPFQNYNDASHGTYPIPLIELNANNKIN